VLLFLLGIGKKNVGKLVVDGEGGGGVWNTWFTCVKLIKSKNTVSGKIAKLSTKFKMTHFRLKIWTHQGNENSA